ncbi:hypothetical protein SAY87_016091 [Trapa incisa]|uniref:Homeobox protein knotted-1-like 6 n=1 Tax=Trapa incisa TaxID=236973 RepID=A0AAN7L7X1_9MYRT|nr:hypothetical protein SAY87_016091 [Trapa incisa]
MEEIYSPYPSTGCGDYYYYYCGGAMEDRGLVTPESLLPPPPPPHHEYLHQAADYLYPLGSEGFRDYRGMANFSGNDAIGTNELASGVSEAASINLSDHRRHHREEEDDAEGVLKAKIKSHPAYPRLLQAYIDCQKVGAPPEIANLLGDIQRENDCTRKQLSEASAVPACSLEADPELDQFMEIYIHMLGKYKSDLEKPFDEATNFLNKIEMQLSSLSIASFSDEGFMSTDEEQSGGEVEAHPRTEDLGLKDRLFRKFGSHISSLKLEFSKKKKKGKLPKEARHALLDWWTTHQKWPYPTEADKKALTQLTGLDQKQINNWFINQRKRHWKPSEDMQIGLMENLHRQLCSDD